MQSPHAAELRRRHHQQVNTITISAPSHPRSMVEDDDYNDGLDSALSVPLLHISSASRKSNGDVANKTRDNKHDDKYDVTLEQREIDTSGRTRVGNGCAVNVHLDDIDSLDRVPLISATDKAEGDADSGSGGDDVEVELKPPTTTIADETYVSIALQVFFPYIIAGFGMVAAGVVLDHVQHWEVFVEVSEIFILVPALLGLKGNLEMTLASRLSTQANLGNMDSRKEQLKMIGGNMALIQCQATVVGLLASVAAVVFGWIPDGVFDINHAFLLCASSITTASLASAVLGSLMIGVVILSRKCNINPDNVATPIAASLGDLVTLSLLSAISLSLYHAIDKFHWLSPVLIIVFLLLLPVWAFLSHKNKYTSKVLYDGWMPVIVAMMISSAGGLILDFAVSRFKGVAIFQPVINGVGGNLVAVQASRLSTTLHQTATLGTLPPTPTSTPPSQSQPANADPVPHGCPNALSTFCHKGSNSKTSRVLLGLVIPGHLIYIYTIAWLKAGHTSITAIFALVYLSAAMIQVLVLLYVANWMVHYMWRRATDPDNAAIPYLTAIGDLLGTALLALSFLFLFLIGDRDADVGE